MRIWNSIHVLGHSNSCVNLHFQFKILVDFKVDVWKILMDKEKFICLEKYMYMLSFNVYIE